MPICRRLAEVLAWPGVVLVYGAAGVGKTTLALEFIKDYCSSKCLFVSTEGLEFVFRAEQMKIDTSRIRVYEALWYTDFLEILAHKDLALYDIVVVDSVNAFVRLDTQKAYNVTLLLSASLYKLSEDYGVPIVETAQVHSIEESYEPVAMKGLGVWSHNIIRLDYVSPGRRRLSVEKPDALELEFRIGEGGIEWLNC